MTNFNTVQNSFLTTDLKTILKQVLDNTSEYLSQFRFDAGYTQKLETAFGNDFNRSVANQIFDKLAQGDFSGIPTIEIVNRNDINGANGAFAIATGKIYLAADFISQNAQNVNAVVDVLLEEVGHFVDSQINTADTAGDEGDIFARLVQGESISQQELAVLRAEDDTATVTLDGQVVEIEMNAQGASQFITLAKPTTTSTTIVGHGSNQEDIIQLHAYNTTSPGLIQQAWGYGGADIFNVTFDTPSNGTVGIDFNAGNLKKMALMLVEPDWDVRGKRIAMDTTAAIVGAAIDYTAAAAGATVSIPFIGGAIKASADVVATTAHLAVDLANITAHGILDIEEYNNSLAGIDNFFADQNNQNWGTVNVLQNITMVDIRDFEPGVDTITLPILPNNWTWQTTGQGIFSNNTKYVSLGYINGSNNASTLLRVGINPTLWEQIQLGTEQGFITSLLTSSHSGYSIGKAVTGLKTTSTSDSFLNGTIANDTLSVLATNDVPVVTLSGGLGDDVLIGRIGGNDALYGGDGNDYIAPGTGSDTINGGAGYDRVDYSNLTTGVNVTSSLFTSIEGVVGTKYNDTLDLSSLTITNLDNLVTGLVSIKGNDGNDTITGSQYSDLLEGGAGSDNMIGGLGNDVYIVDSATDTITENANEGTDRIESSITFSLAALPNIENLTLTGTAAINGTGNAGNNIITGNAGNNTLSGGAGDDIYIIDSTSDTIVENTNEGTDTIQSSVTFSIANLSNIENLTLTGTAAINGTGNAGNNILNSGAGNNILNGGAGIDSLIGGKGDDIYIIDSTSDTIVENTNEGTDTIQSSVTFSIANLSNIENLTLTGTAAINGTGNAGNNILNSGAGNNILNGGAGIDSLIGGKGDDIYIIDSTSDTIVENTNEGTDTIQSSVTFSIANLSNIENLTLTGTAAINGTGNAGNNILNSGAGNNILDGGAGNDTLDGGAGNDTLYGDTDGLGATIYQHISYKGQAQNLEVGNYDLQNLQIGNDSLSSLQVSPGFKVTLYEHLGYSGSSRTFTESTTWVDDFNDKTSSIKVEYINSNDTLNGGADNDNLYGGYGNDLLTGGLGKDALTGGLGTDRFNYRNLADSLLNNFDVITDFNANEDKFVVSNPLSEFFSTFWVTTLGVNGISRILTSTDFQANAAARFDLFRFEPLSFGLDIRTFVAINDATAGFDPTKDAIIEMTGLAGTLGLNNFTTTLA
ncbi:MAG: hypothetical protein HEQ12_14230 [Aphanizomenon flos-aquae DEX188]|nr:MAG: hypothetical protein HEQ12_14230 [Aphanizomenon flos-aquae DEX188]